MLWVVVCRVLLGSSTAIVNALVSFYGDAFELGDTLTPEPVLLTILVASAVVAVVLPLGGLLARPATEARPEMSRQRGRPMTASPLTPCSARRSWPTSRVPTCRGAGPLGRRACQLGHGAQQPAPTELVPGHQR